MFVLFALTASTLVAALPSWSPSTAKGRPNVSFKNLTQVHMKFEGDEHLSQRAYSGASSYSFPDPSLISSDGKWYAYATSSNSKHVPVATSSDAWSWTLSSGDALPTVGAWVSSSDHGIWGPDVQKNDDGTFVMYYTGRSQESGTHCIGTATSSTPGGPYTPQDEPLVCDNDNGGVIDPAGYDDGTDRWIYWKVDGNSRGGATTCQGGGPKGDTYYPTPIKIQRMARDGLTLLDSPVTILDNEGKANDGIVEAPSIYKAPNGQFVLFYSSHCYSSDSYDVEWAWSETINGTFGNRGMLARTSDGINIFGPGGLDIDSNGVNAVFHGRETSDGSRKLYSATLKFDGLYVSGIDVQ